MSSSQLISQESADYDEEDDSSCSSSSSSSSSLSDEEEQTTKSSAASDKVSYQKTAASSDPHTAMKASESASKKSRSDERMRAILFWVCSLGYMAPWTFVGSLIAFFKTSRSANFYVELYAVFYGMGMPTSMIQERYEAFWDTKLGSTWTFLLRGQLNFLAMTMMALVAPGLVLDRVTMLVLMAVLGVCTWMLHGTACMLASMTSTSAISALQTGFRTPEVFALAACYFLRIGSTASESALRLFFFIVAALAVLGLVAWTSLILSPKIRAVLAEKDRELHESDASTRVPLVGDGNDRRSYPLTRADMEMVATTIRHCRVALFWTMFGSIFTAAFFAYATSKNGLDIEQILFFMRLFGDLAGRPFTSLPRPSCLGNSTQLAAFAIARLIFSLIFFVYVFVPGVPQSDTFIIADVAIFSLTSGYIGIISYEYAARDFKTAAKKSYAATLMNTTFQYATFLAVVLSILISELISS